MTTAHPQAAPAGPDGGTVPAAARTHAPVGRRRSALLALAAVAAPLVVLLAAAAGTALGGSARPSPLFDPGALVRWGLPLARGIADLAAAVTVGTLLLAAVALPATTTAGGGGRRRQAFAPALALAAAAAALWALATLTVLVLSAADVFALPLDDPGYGATLGAFVTDDDLGRSLLATTVVAAVVATAAAGTRSLTAAGLLVVAAVAGLVPLALTGHSSGSSSHETAVTSLGLHLLGVVVWVGGLMALLVLRPWLSRSGPGALHTAAARYSTLAGWAFVAVALSGLVNAWLRVPDLGGLAGGYGALLVLKSAAFAVLGVAGLLHRRRALPDLAAGRPGTFARLAGVEVAVMAAALGLSAALSRTAPPRPDRPQRAQSPAESLTGYPLPGPPSAADWVTTWRPDLLWLVVAGLAAIGYVVGLRRLRARGDRWPLGRTVAWFAGLAVLLWVTCGAPAVYGRVLFSAHMVGHMTLSMLVPLLLVTAAPVTLALRTARPRRDGTRGPREWLLVAVESRYLGVLSSPVVAAVLFTGSLVVFYYSDLFGLALRTHLGHELMYAHFLLTGYLFAWVLVGTDPGPRRPSHPVRFVVLLATMAFHAFFGVALISGTTVLEPEWFEGLGRTWGASALDDQQAGGGIAWGIGELPTIVLAMVIAVQWARSDGREQRRHDRKADRDGDAELASYNAMLAAMAERDAHR